MNKLAVFVFYIAFFMSSYSQNHTIYVEYEAVKGRIINTESLIATGQKAVYQINALTQQNPNNIEADEENLSFRINQKTIRLNAKTFYLENKHSIVYFTQNYQNKPALVKDSLPEFTWVISNKETKKIGEFVCIKATTTFRGTNIEAWYAERINIPFGPWKFKGLPGLILELYTTSGSLEHTWRARKVKFQYHNETDFNKDESLPIIDYKTTVIEREHHFKEQMKIADSRTP
ncbi:MAG: GLPGLI family protein, partial [Flavobacteriaceae bacterium]|nr:GLPGLI family protein [Flavobacteriaceae bacterium]